MRILRKLLKIVGILMLFLLVGFGILYMVYNEPIPKGKTGSEADFLAETMLKEMNDEAYHNTRFLEWSFAGGAHEYKWDKENGKVEVKWDDYTVNLNLNDTSRSVVSKNGKQVSSKESRDLTNTAWDYFNNDSFWLVAPFKVYDKGVERKVVVLEDGSRCLLVTYSQGGSTPGDSYLWKFLPSGYPESLQIWSKIIPIGGIEASWENWKEMETGFWLATSRKMGPIEFSMGDIKAYN